jgi:hypothetical protein
MYCTKFKGYNLKTAERTNKDAGRGKNRPSVVTRRRRKDVRSHCFSVDWY